MSGYYGPPIVLPRCKHGAQAYEVCYDCRDGWLRIRPQPKPTVMRAPTHRRPAMSDDLILQLALQAMHDEDALPVMLDAIEETGWDATPAKWLWEDNRALIWVELTVSSWPRAVAAVLLFAGWPTSWPLAERCPAQRVWWSLIAQPRR